LGAKRQDRGFFGEYGMTRRYLLLCVLPLTLGLIACEIEDPNGLRQRASFQLGGASAGSRPANYTIQLNALKEVAINARKAAMESREITAQAKKSLNRVNRLIAALGGGEFVPEVEAAPKAKPKPMLFDHSGFDVLLKKYVQGGLVNYKEWKAKDLPALDAYLDSARLCKPEKLVSDKHRMVFWINVYNAWTLRSMLGFYPTTSILNHTLDKNNNTYGIWKQNPIKIAGNNYHLDGIEHQILRPMGDARIHFAIVCASGGCPPLRGEAFTVSRLNEQLDDNGRVFFSNKEKFKADLTNKSVSLSQIFKWFAKDFGADQSAVLKRLSSWVTDGEIKALMKSGKVKVKYLDYDWFINEQK
jgi:hypothetical protein